MSGSFNIFIIIIQRPALQRLKEKLVKYWVLEASRGRTIEECARF